MSADKGAIETIMFRDGFLTEGVGQQRVGRARGRACWGRRRASTCSKASASSCSRELCEEGGIAYNLRPIAEADVLRRRRAAAQLGDQGSAAGDDARRRAGRPRRAARQARAGVRAAVRGVPARQGQPIDLRFAASAPSRSDEHDHRHADSARAVPDRVPEPVSDQGDGRQRRRLRARRRQRSRGSSIRGSTPRRSNCVRARATTTWA